MSTSEQHPKMVKLWIGNRLDAEVERDPAELGAEFIAAVKGGNLESHGRGVEFNYIWWLNAAFDESDRDVLLDGLQAALDSDPDSRPIVSKWVWGE